MAEGFWRPFLGSLKEHGLTGARLVMFDANLGLTAATNHMFHGSSWHRYQVVFLHNLHFRVPKAGLDMLAPAANGVFMIQASEQVGSHLQRVSEILC